MLNIHLFSFPKIELDIGVALLSWVLQKKCVSTNLK
jgi:hypothetical protein